MRTELVNYFNGFTMTNFVVSSELPFTSNSTVMYLKNPKRIYVDLEQVSNETFMPVMGGDIYQEVHSVSVYFTTDAKNLPSNYQTVVDTLRAGKDVSTVDSSYFKRAVDTNTVFEGDLMVTQLDFRFTKLT